LIGMKAALPLLIAAGHARTGGSSIINIASAAANRADAMTAVYCTSKAALVMLSKVAAAGFAGLGHPCESTRSTPVRSSPR
jgi:NAD(P)-dependent dehydrogenase (short-subunit alcohol dehydrogenase family)